MEPDATWRRKALSVARAAAASSPVILSARL
jgi:hypothetical protein